MKNCENCGSAVYALGCVNCEEQNYIQEQEELTNPSVKEKNETSK